MEDNALPTIEQFAAQLAEITGYAFFYGIDFFSDEQRTISFEEWEKHDRTIFMQRCREGFKVARKLLIERVIDYQKKHTENKARLKASRSGADKKITKSFLDQEKVIIRRLHNLSHIADGLAIQMMAGQVHIAKRLHIGEKSSKQLEHSNIAHAIREADNINQDPDKFALISDLTSFIQIGDLFVSDNMELYLIELKEGKTNEKIREYLNLTEQKEIPCKSFRSNFSDKEKQQMKRMKRQDQRAKQAVEVINTDVGIDVATGGEIRVSTPTICTERYDSLFIEMNKEIEQRNWSYRLVEDCVHSDSTEMR